MCDYQHVFACGGKLGSYMLSFGLCEAKTKHKTTRTALPPALNTPKPALSLPKREGKSADCFHSAEQKQTRTFAHTIEHEFYDVKTDRELNL